MFTHGFVKTALQDDGDSAKRNSAIAGILGGGATYGALRSGKKTNLMRTVDGEAPKSFLGKHIDRALYGADDVGYVGSKEPRRPQKYHGTVMHFDSDTIKHHKGTKNLGNFTDAQQSKFDDKYVEHKMLKKHVKHHPKASLLDNFGGGKEGIKKLVSKYDKGFLVKPLKGFASGVGGASFLNEDDYIHKYLGVKNKNAREKLLSKSNRSASKNLVQERLNIKKDALTGASREVRVHAVGGKVIPGASSIRGKNVTDLLHTRSAEKYFQKVLNRLPAKHKPAHMTWAPDIAMTDKGMRVIETNRGHAASGLIDPKFLRKTHGRVGGTLAAAQAVSANNAIYKHVTGRHTRLAAGGRALAAGGALAGLAHYVSKHRKEKS